MVACGLTAFAHNGYKLTSCGLTPICPSLDVLVVL